MTTIAKDFAAKASVAIVAAAMAISAFAPAAQAQTTDELQQMINDLLAQVAGLQSQLGQGGSSVASGVCPYTWTRDLSSGSTGADVMKLQQFLNADADTRVSAEGVGSAGMETEYYGPATAAAVSKLQVKYRADILSPAGLVNPTGYFGPGTRAKANSLCVAAPVVDEDDGDMTDDEDVDEDVDEDEDEDDGDLSGEADLKSVDLNDGESSLEEGEEDVDVAEFTVEFDNGDAEISRIDVALVADAGNGEMDPWDVFETVSLWVDGDKVAEENADDEDDYLDEDDGTLRFSGLDIVAREDDEVEIIVAVTLQNNLDSMPETWNIDIDAMRWFDADGVATTESAADLDVDAIEFDIEEAGADEEIKVSLSSNNPDAADVVVDTDTDTDDVTILVADVEAEDNDIELKNVVVKIETSASTTKIVDDVRVIIDGESFDAESIGGTPGTYSQAYSVYVDNDGSDDAVWYTFDIDGDVVIDADDEVELEVVVDLNDTDDGARYANGSTIKASITQVEREDWDAEGADDLDPAQFKGTAIGDEMVLVAEGIIVPVDGFDSSVITLGTNDTIGEFTLEFEVTAVEGDFYVYNEAAPASTTPTYGVAYTVTGGAATITDALDSTADEDTANVFTVREGETETFTLTVTVDPAAAGTFRVELDSVFYTDNANGQTGAVEYMVTPETDFRTAQKAINN